MFPNKPIRSTISPLASQYPENGKIALISSLPLSAALSINQSGPLCSFSSTAAEDGFCGTHITQDLSPVHKTLRTYAVTWVNPNRKLRTPIDDHGQTNPTWNDKCVFRVDDKFLNSDSSFVMIEIYAVGWLRDTLVGSVRVMISNLVPPEVRHDSSRRFVALQIRRPSGRPQGIINIAVTLLDNTMRSMPLYIEPSKSNKKNKGNEKMVLSDAKKAQLQRTLSDHTDLTMKCSRRNTKKVDRGGSVLNYNPNNIMNGNGSVVNVVNSVVNGGSMLNGSVCNSDVGPSPSVVAAAVAIGLYPTQLGPPPKPGSSMLEDWKVEESSMEGLKSKIERWRMDIPAKYDIRYQRIGNERGKKYITHRRRKTVGEETGSGLFSCFGNAYGCEFTIVCGAHKEGRKNKVRGHGNSQISVSELDS